MSEESRKAWDKAYRDTHKEEIRTYHKVYNDAHKEERKAHYAAHKEECRQKHQTLKLIVFQHYSRGVPKCALCGIDDVVVLTIDHIDNRGAEHRKKIGKSSGRWFYTWLRKNGYPEGYQVLCRNCNYRKYIKAGRGK